jgi:hypothetical protein
MEFNTFDYNTITEVSCTCGIESRIAEIRSVRQLLLQRRICASAAQAEATIQPLRVIE